MKILVILVVIVAIAAGAFVFISNKNANDASKFTLVKEEGTIFYKETETGEYTELFDEEVKLGNGTFIKTDEESFSRVFLPDNSMISLDEQTEVQINFDDKAVNIEQLIGKTWNRVQTLTKGEEFKVETPNTIAAVRGTIFGVGVDDDDHSRVFVEENKVNVGKYDKDDADKTILEDVDLEVGILADIVKEATLEIDLNEIPDDFKDTFWYRRNKIIDEEWNKIKDKKDVDLQKLLKENLQKRDDYDELKLGLEPAQTDLSKIQDELADAYKLANINQNTCQNNSLDQIQNAMDQVKRYKGYVTNADDIIALLYTLKEVCADGEISAEEAELLQELVNNANQ